MLKIFSLLFLMLTFANASQLQRGSALALLQNIEYQTPQGNAIKIPKETKLIIISSEKDTGKLVNEYLSTQSSNYLQKRGAIFIADINKMPSIITKAFALPKLRSFAHTIYLNYGEELAEKLPPQDDKIMLVFFKTSKIKEIRFISTKEELQVALSK